jgi:hypothetical protein
VATRRIAGLLERLAPQIRRQLGVAVEVYRVRAKDARNPRVRAALKRRGVGSLPAVLAGGRAYVGCREIEEFYARALAPPRPRESPEPAAPRFEGPEGEPGAELPDDSAQDALDAFYRTEMRVGPLGGEVDVRDLDLDDSFSVGD